FFPGRTLFPAGAGLAARLLGRYGLNLGYVPLSRRKVVPLQPQSAIVYAVGRFYQSACDGFTAIVP
ncbi:MAG: hypothetical protein ACI4UC_01455, partial [Alloprevotella sp.]